jgi:very-short-patch-repair endonuclease
MDTPERRLAAIATGQLGLLTRRQAHLMRVSDDQLRRRVTSGALEQVGPNTFRLFGSQRDARSDLLGQLLDAGPRAYAGGRTAAALFGLDTFVLEPPFDIVTVRGRRVRRSEHRIHTTGDLAPIDVTRVAGIPSLSAARTIIDLARTESPKRLAAALDSALRDRALTEDRLHERIVALRSSGRYGIPELLAVIEGDEITRGGHSWLERRFLELVGRAGLRRPRCQQVEARSGSRLVRVDFRFPGTPVIVEVLGYRYHATRAQLARDAARLNALLDQGLRPYQFTYDHVVGAADEVIDTLRAALSGRATA